MIGDNHNHRISVAPSGRLIFHNHPEGINVLKVFAALGGKPDCKCLGILSAWRTLDPLRMSKIYDDLRSDAGRASVKRSRRLMASKVVWGTDRLAIPLNSRLVWRICDLARPLATNTYPGMSIRVVWSNVAAIWHNQLSEATTFGLDGRRWYKNVYRRGIAVVGGVFVLDVLSEDERGIHVLAGRQGRGFNVYSAEALILPNGGIQWIKG